jgi:hypothetical protein
VKGSCGEDDKGRKKVPDDVIIAQTRHKDNLPDANPNQFEVPPQFWAIVILLLFPFLYRLSEGIGSITVHPVSWIDYFHYSLAAFSTIGFPDLVPVNHVAKLLTNVEALLGISALALLMFALGNRISQR